MSEGEGEVDERVSRALLVPLASPENSLYFILIHFSFNNEALCNHYY